MAALLFIVLLQFAWSFADPESQGGGSYAYSDSTGNRYSGTYGLKDGRVFQSSGDFPTPFSDAALPGYDYGYGNGFQGDNFYPNFFSNLENLLQEAFRSNVNQRIAFDAARRAYDLSSNQPGYYSNFASRFPQPAFSDYGRFGGGYNHFPYPNFEMPRFPNSAYASGAIGPGYRRQIAAINPANPNSPNVDINRINHYSDTPGRGGYYSVSSSSYSSSNNVNGQEVSRRGAETLVNDNGKITKYRVEN